MCGDSVHCDYLTQVKQYRNEYYKKNKAKLNKFTNEYYTNNKEHLLELQKNYRINNNEILKAMRNQKYNCECGGKYTLTNKSRHIMSKKHIKWSNTIVTDTNTNIKNSKEVLTEQDNNDNLDNKDN